MAKPTYDREPWTPDRELDTQQDVGKLLLIEDTDGIVHQVQDVKPLKVRDAESGNESIALWPKVFCGGLKLPASRPFYSRERPTCDACAMWRRRRATAKAIEQGRQP